MPRRSAAQGRRAREIERTRQDILDAAARVFAERGYHEATMAAIAREAGFTAASLYTYFPGKDEIFAALVLDMKRALLASFDAQVPAGLTFAQRLELLLQRQLELVASRRDALRVAFDVHSVRRAHDERPTEFLDRLAAFLGSAGKALRFPPADAAQLLFGLVHGAVLPWFTARTAPDAAGTATRIVDVFLHGVARRDAAQP